MESVSKICTPKTSDLVEYGVRKYAGNWVPVVVVNGRRKTFAHCSTSRGAMEIAMRQAKAAVGVAD